MSTETVEPTVLIDNAMDGAVEERGWVPVAQAADEEAAIAKLSEDFPATKAGDNFAYEVNGRSYHRPVPSAEGESGGYWFIFEDDGPEDFEDRRGHWSEFLPWRSCEADAPGAVEFWTLELVELPAAENKEEG